MAGSDTNGGLVHIRCCYNNKYWVNSGHFNRVMALAKQRNEDLSDESFTLFKPKTFSIDNITVVRFVHVRTNIYLSADSEFHSIVGDEKNDEIMKNEKIDEIVEDEKKSSSLFLVVDWLVLPQYVAFKDKNGRYLSANDSASLQFSGTDIGDRTVGSEIFYTNHGNIRIKSNHNGKFWRPPKYGNTIYADADDDSDDDPDTWFSAVKLNDKAIALRNLGNSQFCASVSDDGCLTSTMSTINRLTRLEVEETVISREISDVRFRINDAKIYAQFPVVLASGELEFTNWNAKGDQLQELILSYTLTESSTWNNSVSLKLCTDATIQTGVPFIADGGVKISSEFSGAYSWGENKESSYKLRNHWTGEVPKNTWVTVSMLATKVTCEVPFSYTQEDTLVTGKRVTYRKDDGVYTGSNFFNLVCETNQRPIRIIECEG